MNKSYVKVFALDTNIILNNANNLETLSQSGENLIILPATVLDELDSKKSGFDEINFQARNFARLLYDAKIDGQTSHKDLSIIETSVGKIKILIIDKKEYKADLDQVPTAIKNDRKILEATENISEIYPDLTFLSLDVMARTRALSLGLKTEAMDLGFEETDIERDFHAVINVETFDGEIEFPEIEYYHTSLEIIDNSTGRHSIYTRNLSGWTLIPDKNENRLCAPPINLRQKAFAELILDRNDIIIASGPAGTGKNLIATAAAMRLMDLNKKLYKKIYYIRRTVISGGKEDELGFLPGDLAEKMQGYNQPMEDTLKKIAQLKKKEQTKDEIQERVEKLKIQYDIEYLYAGHLRGSTLEEGSILICDEIQNWDVASIRTIFSRLGKDSIIIGIGSNNQIDSSFLTKNNNALTFLINKCGKENTADVRVAGVKLIDVMRSKIAEYADEELIQK